MKNTAHGYTLLEILVSTSILIMVVGGGITAFRNFDDREKLVSEGRAMAVEIREIQASAKNGEKPTQEPPTGCGTDRLVSWKFKSTSTREYEIIVVCEAVEVVVNNMMLRPGIEFSEVGTEANFSALTGKAQAATTIRLINSNNAYYEISVNPSGGVLESGYETD